MTIETERLRLIPCDIDILRAAIEGNNTLSRKLNVEVPEHWTEFGVGALQYSISQLSSNEEERDWWTYFPILKQKNQLIGSGGYKGKPSMEGTVEIGYEIAPEFRNLGLATEMTLGLVRNAFGDNRVRSILAHTLGESNPSTRVLQKCGFEKVEEVDHPDHGLIWKWELKRSNWI